MRHRPRWKRQLPLTARLRRITLNYVPITKRRSKPRSMSAAMRTAICRQSLTTLATAHCVTTGTLSMNLGSAPLSFDEITVTTIGNTRHVHGVKSTTDSYSIDFDIEVGQTGLDKITNFELRVFSHTYTPMIPSAFGNDWTSNITVNTDTSVVGTFSGELESTTATNIQDLLNGVVDLDF